MNKKEEKIWYERELNYWIYHLKRKICFYSLSKIEQKNFNNNYKKFLKETKDIDFWTFEDLCSIFYNYCERQNIVKYESEALNEALNLLKKVKKNKNK